jgi:hypothetical protein
MLSLLIIIHDFLKQMSSLQTSYLIMFCSTLYIIYFCNELLLLILLQLIKKEWISFGGCCWVHKKQWISFVHFLILLLIIVYDFLKQKSCNVLFSITNLSLNWYFFYKVWIGFFCCIWHMLLLGCIGLLDWWCMLFFWGNWPWKGSCVADSCW